MVLIYCDDKQRKVNPQGFALHLEELESEMKRAWFAMPIRHQQNLNVVFTRTCQRKTSQGIFQLGIDLIVNLICMI